MECWILLPKVGGGTVEVSKIKIATVTGGGADVVTNSIAFCSAGAASLTDGKTFGELVGAKKVVRFCADIPTTTTGSTEEKEISTAVLVGVDSASYVNPLLSEGDAVNNAKVISAFIIATGTSANMNGKPIDIYAICI